MFNELVHYNDNIYLSNGLKIFLLNDGKLCLKVDLQEAFGYKNTFIRKIAVSDKLLAIVLDSKLFVTVDLETLQKTYETVTYKRAMFMYFNQNQKSVYLGDRAGDIYEIHLDPELPMKLLIGTVSISTDMAFTNDHKFVITADRDEKIRINHFPNTFDINHYCLGHKEYVSKLVVIPKTTSFLSAGGDNELFLWDYSTGELIKTVSLVENIELGKLKPDVACMELFNGKLLVIVLQKFKSILLFDVTGKSITFKKSVEMTHEPIKACFDSKGNIWCTINSKEKLLDLVVAEDDYELAAKNAQELSQLHVDQSLITQDATDFYEISKLRKWSQWEPHSKPATVAEKRKVMEEAGKVKKSKRSGKKQKDKRELNEKTDH